MAISRDTMVEAVVLLRPRCLAIDALEASAWLPTAVRTASVYWPSERAMSCPFASLLFMDNSMILQNPNMYSYL